ncbi:ATP-binding protein [Streptodolium elevatio]
MELPSTCTAAVTADEADARGAPVPRAPAAPAPPGQVVAELRVPADGSRAHAVRRFVREQLLHHTSAPDHTVDDAVLLANELFTNAVRHTPAGHIAVRLVHDPRHRTFAVLVDDPDPRPPAPAIRCAGNDADAGESGRGLALVAGFALDWGWHPSGTGKSVWFAMSTGPEPGQPPPHQRKDSHA